MDVPFDTIKSGENKEMKKISALAWIPMAVPVPNETVGQYPFFVAFQLHDS